MVVFTGNTSTSQACSKSASCAVAGRTGKDPVGNLFGAILMLSQLQYQVQRVGKCWAQVEVARRLCAAGGDIT